MTGDKSLLNQQSEVDMAVKQRPQDMGAGLHPFIPGTSSKDLDLITTGTINAPTSGAASLDQDKILKLNKAKAKKNRIVG